jgi:maleylacetate reductase
MQNFTYITRPSRVIFGRGTLSSIGREVATLGLKRVLIVSTPGQKDLAGQLATILGTGAVAIHAHAAMHTPVTVTEDALKVVREKAIDGVAAIGGGSAIGLSKAIALRSELPQLVVPTTYAGSEMTPILGETAEGRKITLADPKVVPNVVLYDVDLTLSLSSAVSAASGMNAIAHAVEALYAKDRNPVISLMAVEGISALTRALPAIVRDGQDTKARSDALYGAWLCGTCLGAVGMALHHKLCHTLGGSFGLPHAQTHAVVLPHTLAYNASAAPDMIRALAPVLGNDPAAALHKLASEIRAPKALRDLGMAEADIAAAAELVMANPYWNPRPVEFGDIRTLISRAWAGEAPQG